MAVCDYCRREMTDPGTVTCTGNRKGVPFSAKPLTEDQWMAGWRRKMAEFAASGFPSSDTEGEARGRMAEYMARKDRCGDCNVRDGGRHHPGCDNERCRRCGGQRIGCGCRRRA